MKKTNYGTIVLTIIGLMMCVGCSQVSFNNPFGESEPTRTNVDTADNTADNQDASSDNQTDKSTPVEYKIHYLNAKNANNPNKMSFLETDTIVLKDVSADGFAFDGWYEVTDNIADTSTDGWNAGSKTADVTLWAKWTAINNDPTDPIEPVTPTEKVYTIKFNNNTGSGIMADITADVGATITLPTCTFNAPTGKKFSCWNGKADGSDGINYANGASVKNLADTNGAVVTLYAQWIDKDAHRIVYHNTKNADNSSNPTSFKESEPVMLTDVRISGWTFGGWYDSSADGTIVSGWSAGERTDDVSLWAKWTANEVTYTVKRYFQYVSGSGYDTSADIVKSGLTDAITDVTADIVTGFTAQHIAQQIIAGDSSTVVSVYYDRNVVVYTFNANGGSWDDGSNVKKAVGLYGATVETPVNPSRVGYTYADWDKTLPTVFGETAETWTAQWTANSYTIVFNANDGTGDMSNQDMTYDVEAALTANAFSKVGYTFLGWSDNSSATVATYTNEQSVLNLAISGSITLYAVWKSNWHNNGAGDFVYDNVVCEKTSMVTVLSQTTDITCDQSGGVFPTARGSVTLGKYAIGKYEVTQQLYTAVMGSNPSDFQSGTALGTGETNYLLRPVEQVSWYDAITFCNKLSTLMGKTRCYKLSDGTYPEDFGTIPTSNNTKWDNATCDWEADGYRLPTECEWECAARGGTYSAGTPWTYTYSGSNTVGNVAWYTSNSSSHTWEVGLKDPNDLGLYDMSGNVNEWCWDNYNSAAITAETPATGPATNSSSAFGRRLQGGSWGGDASSCSVSLRSNFYPYVRFNGRGFRLACLQF